jgi:hypothetical protein
MKRQAIQALDLCLREAACYFFRYAARQMISSKTGRELSRFAHGGSTSARGGSGSSSKIPLLQSRQRFGFSELCEVCPQIGSAQHMQIRLVMGSGNRVFGRKFANDSAPMPTIFVVANCACDMQQNPANTFFRESNSHVQILRFGYLVERYLGPFVTLEYASQPGTCKISTGSRCLFQGYSKRDVPNLWD